MKKEEKVALCLSGQFKELTQKEMSDQYDVSGNLRIATLTVSIPEGWYCVTWATVDGENHTVILQLSPEKEIEDSEEEEEDEEEEEWEDDYEEEDS